MGIDRCRTCNSDLVDGPHVDRTGSSGRFACTLSAIPTKVCPRGCGGFYWYWLDFGVEIFDALSPDSPNIAIRKFGFPRMKDCCRACGSQLVDSGTKVDFRFSIPLKKGTVVLLTVSAPSLSCPACHRLHMPAQRSSQDTYYKELSTAISATITLNLNH